MIGFKHKIQNIINKKIRFLLIVLLFIFVRNIFLFHSNYIVNVSKQFCYWFIRKLYLNLK